MKPWLVRLVIFSITLVITISLSWKAEGRSTAIGRLNNRQNLGLSISTFPQHNKNLIASSLVSISNHVQAEDVTWQSAQLMIPNRVENRYRTNDMWQSVYAIMPELPLENHYRNIETDEAPDADYTLIRRLIRYHIYNQNRPPIFRLDWKLTLADYLGFNEQINVDTYPGANVLDPHPLSGDRAAIANLSPQQRDRLVEVLVSLFNPNYMQLLEDQVNAEALSAPGVNQQPEPVNTRDSNLPTQPQPGDAQLLIPGDR